MTTAQFERESLYQTTIAIARSMLRNKLLTEDEFTIIDAKMREKYKPVLGSLSPLKTAN